MFNTFLRLQLIIRAELKLAALYRICPASPCTTSRHRWLLTGASSGSYTSRKLLTSFCMGKGKFSKKAKSMSTSAKEITLPWFPPVVATPAPWAGGCSHGSKTVSPAGMPGRTHSSAEKTLPASLASWLTELGYLSPNLLLEERDCMSSCSFQWGLPDPSCVLKHEIHAKLHGQDGEKWIVENATRY